MQDKKHRFLFPLFILITVLAVGLAGPAIAADDGDDGGTITKEAIYIVTDGSKNLDQKHLLLESEFWIWSSYDSTTMEYTKGNRTIYQATINYPQTRIPKDPKKFIEFVDGGHLVITANGQTIYDGYTHEDNLANTAQYRWGLTEAPTFIFTILGTILALCCQVANHGLVERRAR